MVQAAALADPRPRSSCSTIGLCRRLTPLLLLLLAVAIPLKVNADDALDWLGRMSEAIRDLNYRGTFVYAHDGQLEAMYIAHRGGEDSRQRLFALTGAAREVVRDQSGVTCILPDSKAVMVDRGMPQTPFADLPRDLGQLHQHYVFSLQGRDRISRRPTQVVLIQPRDDYRYGYRFWLDSRHGLPLRSELVTAEGKPLEQMMFTQIDVLHKLDDAELQPALSGEEFAHYEGDMDAEGTDDAARPQTNWEFGWIPDGFELRDHNWHGMPVDNEKVEHWVFSDGLATVSVYIEALEKGRQEGLEGVSNMGAVNAMGRTVNGHHITVVGEVPRKTVEQLAMGIRQQR